MSASKIQKWGIENGTHGRFVSTHALNGAQAVFVREYVANGGDRQKAARLAGYSDPRTEGYRLLNTQKVRDAIKREQERIVVCEGGSQALATMLALLGEETQHIVRFQAAKWILEAAGLGLAANAANMPDSTQEKPLSEMSLQELQEVLQRGAQGLGSPVGVAR
jgi:Terminase small subunit